MSAAPAPGGGFVPSKFKILRAERLYMGPVSVSVDVQLPSGIVFNKVILLAQAGREWSKLPTRPFFNDKGQPVLARDKRPLYEPVVEIPNPECKDAFDRLVWAAYRAYEKEVA